MGTHKPTKKRITKKSNKANHTVSKEKLDALETLFFTGGISSYAASRDVGIDPKTSAIYFEEWAEKLVSDEDHITWATKEKFAKARYKEGITKRIMKIKNRLAYFENRLTKIMTIKKNNILVANDHPDENKLERYERYVRNTETQLTELQQEYAIVDMMPPTEILLKKEIERIMSETQHI